jgi:transcriptional regulator with XRE-family HTH domain
MDVLTPKSSSLREIREERGLSLRELGFFANCSHVTLSKLERGQVDASAALKTRIAHALGVSVQRLWGADGSDEAA